MHGVFEENLVWSMIHQPILHTSTEEACDESCCSVIDGKLQLKHASAAKKVTNKNKIKKNILKMYQDVGIADQPKTEKQGRDDSSSVYNLTLLSFHIQDM